MSRAILIACVSIAMLSGCIRAGAENTSRLQNDGSDLKPSSQITHDCFKQLSPVGPIQGDKYAAVLATKGVCIGKGVAVSDLTRVDEVSLNGPDGQSARSAMYADGEKVLVKVGDRQAVIGTIVTSDKGSEMKLAPGVSFEASESEVELEVNWN